MDGKRSTVRNLFLGISSILMILTLYMIFLYVPVEREMGIVQKIFYLMVPMGWLALLSFLIVFIGSILYLIKKDSRWDILAHSSATIGILCTALALLVGAIWAKPVWGVWWTWEARLTATLVLFMIYVAYFMVRSFTADEARGATFAAVVGIIGFIDIPIIALATTLWRGMHPGGIIFAGGLAPSMLLTLIISLFSFTLFYFLLLRQQISLKNSENRLKELQQHLS
jgi:heme exporter protein C